MPTTQKQNKNTPLHIVAAGSFHVEDSEHVQLTALLGTCIGVAIFDKDAGVGGIIHLLLPEPTGTSTAWQPLCYASTGLPIFIKELLDAGASRENMEAHFAGGSLLAPVSPRDVDLNIGGRTAKVVHKTLNNEGIRIVSSLTGGYFGTKLILDTGNWQVSVQPSIPKHDGPAIDFQKPSNEDIERAILVTEPIPQIALKIIELIRNKNYDASDLLREIERDQVISARVLRLCNSSLFGVRGKIDSIERAVLLLGENHLLDVVTSAAVTIFFTQDGGGYSLMRGGLYSHSVGVAHVAKIIAAFTGRTPPDTAYTGGLLHDIGKVVLDCFLRDLSPLFYARIRTEHIDFTELEDELIGTDHQKAGERLATIWNLPENIREVVSLHHYPERATLSPELVHIVHIADILTSCFLAGMEMDRIYSSSLPQRLHHVGLKASQLPVIIDRVPWADLTQI